MKHSLFFCLGVDSFIEVMSGICIALMVMRLMCHPESERSWFELKAQQVTGIGFYLLSLGLLGGIVLNLITGHKPETTFSGVLISLVSIAVMWWLVSAKMKVGNKLNSSPIIADAGCTKVCVYMSVVLLVSSLIYELTGFAYADVIGAAGLIYFSFTEGREAFEKANNKECHCCV